MTAPVRAISGAAAAPPAARCQSKRGSVATQAQRPPAASAAAESASTERTAADTGAFAHPMGPEEFRAAAHEVVDWIADYMTTVEERPVRSQVEPGYLMSALPTSCPEQGESWDACMRDLEGLIMPGVTHWQHPSFFAYYPANSSGPGMLGEMLSAAINCIGFSWIASPAATELETVALDWLGQLVGLPASFLSATGTGGGGVIQGTASEAALVALLAARSRAVGPPASLLGAPGAPSKDEAQTGSKVGPGEDANEVAGRLVAYASDQAHSCVQKACAVAGVHHFRTVPTTGENGYRMTGDALDRIIQEDIAKGLVPCFVCATLGTTSSGAVDDIPAVADVAAKHGMWTHIDAAYAGSCMVLPELRHHLAGVDKVDSIDFNPHKGLLVNFDMSAMYVRDRAPLVRALTLNPEFLRNAATDAGAVTDYKDWQVPLGRRFRALKLWLVLRTYGAEGIRGYMRHHMGLAADFEAWVEADERFEVCADRHFGLVCFRLRGAPDAANAELLERLNATGKTFLTGTSLDGKFTLRLAVGGTNTGAVHVAECWQLICEEAEAVLKEAAGAN